MSVPDELMDEARALVRDRLGLDFPSRRDADLARALGTAGSDPRGLLDTLREQPLTDPSWRAVISALTIQESYFFRDTALYSALTERILPALIAERRLAGDLRLSLWSAGCAEGQEPYSLAMLLDRLLPDRKYWQLSIIATDLDAGSLDVARTGVYGDWALREFPAWAREHFDSSEPKRHVLDPRIREMVRFAPLNLTTDQYPGAVDVVLCRNVLMYLTDDARHAAVVRLAQALVGEGWLVLSPLDSTVDSEARRLVPEELCGVRFLRRRESAPVVEREPPQRRRVPAGDAPAAEPRHVATRRSAAPDSPAGVQSRPEPPVVVAGTAPLERARAAADRGDLDDAIALCQQALSDDPLDAEAHLLSAAVEEEREDLTAAIAAVRRAIYSAPDSATAHFRLGSLLLRRGDEDAARRSLTTAAELFGERAPASLLARVAP